MTTSLIENLFGSDRYRAVIQCYTHDTALVTLYMISDVIMFLSLTVVAYVFHKKRNEGYYFLPYQCAMAFAVVFLLATLFLIDVVTIFDGVYRIEIVVRGALSGVSVVFAFSLCCGRR